LTSTSEGCRIAGRAVADRRERTMFFRQLLHEERSCASYVIGCPSRGVAAVVDPQGEVSRYLSLVE
jgi:hypothetical protein